MKTTGPVLLIGGITITNELLINKSIDYRVPIATGIAAGGFALLEKLNEDLALALVWSAVITLLFTRTNRNTPAPAETLNKLWGGSLK